jgi:hypothetical protein
MEIKGTGVWVGGYQAVEEPLQPLPENWSCPEDLAAMKRPKMYSLEALWPKSCFPVTVSEDQLSEVYTRGTDPWGTHMVPLTEKECSGLISPDTSISGKCIYRGVSNDQET